MRPQIVIALLVFMAVGLGGVLYFKKHSASEPVVSSPNPTVDAPPVTVPVVAPATVEKVVPSVVATATRPALTPGIQHPCISSLEVWVAWAKRHHLAAALAASQRSTNALVTAVTNRLSKYLYPPTSNDMPSFIAAASLTTNRSTLDINYCTYMWLAHATSRGPSPDAIPAPAP